MAVSGVIEELGDIKTEEDPMQTIVRILLGLSVQLLLKVLKKRRDAKRAQKRIDKLERKGKEVPEELLSKAGKSAAKVDKKETRKQKKEEMKQEKKEKKKKARKRRRRLLLLLLVVALVGVVLQRVRGGSS